MLLLLTIFSSPKHLFVFIVIKAADSKKVILINLLILANRDSSTWMQYKLARDTRQHADNLTDSMNKSTSSSSHLRILKIIAKTEKYMKIYETSQTA